MPENSDPPTDNLPSNHTTTPAKEFPNPTSYFPKAFAHRGYSAKFAQNSTAAFQAAYNLGFRYFETDVHCTSDGYLVAFHDENLDPLTDQHGPIAELPWARVQQAKIAGVEPIPLFTDLVNRWPDVFWNVDLKNANACKALAKIIIETDLANRICIASFSDKNRRACLNLLREANIDGPIINSAGKTTMTRFWIAAKLRAPRWVLKLILGEVTWLQTSLIHNGVKVLTPGFLKAARKAGVQVHIWTINDEPTMRALLQLKIDGIITDECEKLQKIMRAKKCWGEPQSNKLPGTLQ